jgi:hypothetical protein
MCSEYQNSEPRCAAVEKITRISSENDFFYFLPMGGGGRRNKRSNGPRGNIPAKSILSLVRRLWAKNGTRTKVNGLSPLGPKPTDQGPKKNP